MFGHEMRLRAAAVGLSGMILGGGAAHAAIIVVDSAADTAADDGMCTLREAIVAANDDAASGLSPGECPAGDAGLDTIQFALGSGTPTIALASALPFVTAPVVIDGATGGATRVELNGAGSSVGSGLTITGGGSTLRALVVNRFPLHGIALLSDGNHVENCRVGTDAGGTSARGNGGDGVLVTAGAGNVIGGTSEGTGNLISGNAGRGVELVGNGTGNLVAGNLIGTDAGGATALANADIGVLVFADDTMVGGTTAAARNVISGNGNSGIRVDGASGTVIAGNYVGTDVTGAVDVGNATDGVLVTYGAVDTVVGGTSPGAGNVVSGNEWRGIAVSQAATGTIVQGNRIGTNAAGSAALGNTLDGIGIFAPGGQIGGTTAGAGNVISGNGLPSGSGVYLDPGGGGTVVQGNRIGTNAAGTAALHNAFNGVQIRCHDNVVGGTVAGAGNQISGNTTSGLLLTAGATRNVIAGNLIGTDAAGTGALGNGRDGVTLGSSTTGGASGNVVGGLDAGAGNVIAFNGRDGIRVTVGTGDALLSNAIFSNKTLGIDLAGDGVTVNDGGTPPDADAGPNELQNFPALDKAESGGGVTAVSGTLASTPSTEFTVQLFASPSCDGSYGEGRQLVGTTVFSTAADGGGAFALDLPVDVTPGWVITATATNAAHATSEFSACLTVTLSTTTTTASTTTTARTSTVTSTSATTSTTTRPAEICGNCIDDDGDGRTDFEDPACCGAAGVGSLTLRAASIRPKRTGVAFALRAQLSTAGEAPSSAQDVFLQLRPGGGSAPLCARFPAEKFRAGKRRWTFRDRTHADAGTRAIERVVVTVPKRGAPAIMLQGRAIDLVPPAAGTMQVTVAFAGEDRTQCAAVVRPFRAIGRKGALKVP